jgi:hypothetical protein
MNSADWRVWSTEDFICIRIDILPNQLFPVANEVCEKDKTGEKKKGNYVKFNPTK